MKKSASITVIAFAIAAAALLGQFGWIAPLQFGW